MNAAVAEFGQRWKGASVKSERVQKAPATPPVWQAERPMASTAAVFTPVMQRNTAPSPDSSLLTQTPLLRRIGVRGPTEGISPLDPKLHSRMGLRNAGQAQ